MNEMVWYREHNSNIWIMHDNKKDILTFTLIAERDTSHFLERVNRLLRDF